MKMTMFNSLHTESLMNPVMYNKEICPVITDGTSGRFSENFSLKNRLCRSQGTDVQHRKFTCLPPLKDSVRLTELTR